MEFQNHQSLRHLRETGDSKPINLLIHAWLDPLPKLISPSQCFLIKKTMQPLLYRPPPQHTLRDPPPKTVENLGPTRRRRVASDGGEVGCVICSSISYALLAMAHTSIRHLDFGGKKQNARH